MSEFRSRRFIPNKDRTKISNQESKFRTRRFVFDKDGCKIDCKSYTRNIGISNEYCDEVIKYIKQNIEYIYDANLHKEELYSNPNLYNINIFSYEEDFDKTMNDLQKIFRTYKSIDSFSISLDTINIVSCDCCRE
jgi:hypothetical protein